MFTFTFKLDFRGEIDRAIKGNARFFISEKAEKLDTSIINDIPGENYKTEYKESGESFLNFSLEHDLHEKYGIRYMEGDGRWFNFYVWHYQHNIRFVLCCLPILSDLTLEQFKNIGLDYARKNNSPGIIFNDNEKHFIQIIRTGNSQISEIYKNDFDFEKHINVLYDSFEDTRLELNEPQTYNSCYGSAHANGHLISPIEKFYEFENIGSYKLKINDKNFSGIFSDGVFTNIQKPLTPKERLGTLYCLSTIIEYSKYPEQILDVSVYANHIDMNEMIHRSILFATRKSNLPFKQINVRIYDEYGDIKIISNTNDKDHPYFLIEAEI